MSNSLSQEEINALLGSVEAETAEILSEMQKDILGEVGNISMGTSATTLSTLLNQKVQITSPNVKIMGWKEISDSYDRPCVGVKIDYTMGIKGSNILILRNNDVRLIADLMMGGQGQIPENDDNVSELELSAVGEAMNQMIGSSSTSLSTFVDERIDIATPKAFQLDFNEDNFAKNFGFTESSVAVVTFRLTIGDLLDSEIMQIYPMEFAVSITEQLQKAFAGGASGVEEVMAQSSPTPDVAPPQQDPSQASPQPQMMQQPQQMAPQPQMMQQPQQMTPQPQMMQQSQQMIPQPQMAVPPMYAQGAPSDVYGSGNNFNYAPQSNINAQPAQFQNFDTSQVVQQKENIDILMDVPLEVTVELGKTTRRIKEILEFSPGTIIELDKLAGEPIDILVNGKYVAKGEVVVIDENFGIRVTSIISPELRI